jgi:hypothetical protein
MPILNIFATKLCNLHEYFLRILYLSWTLTQGLINTVQTLALQNSRSFQPYENWTNLNKISMQIPDSEFLRKSEGIKKIRTANFLTSLTPSLLATDIRVTTLSRATDFRRWVRDTSRITLLSRTNQSVVFPSNIQK